jgi:hypothetical protein
MERIKEATFRLHNYIESENYAGFDPYDGLCSPIFKLPCLKSNKKIRFLSQQLIKRSPINLRKILAIRKGVNPVSLGLSIQSYAYLSTLDQTKNYTSKIEFLLNSLEDLASKDFSGICWGYNFDWEARYASIKAFQPTIVATGIITNALFECWKITKNQRCKELILESSNVVLKDLNRTFEGETFCFSYSPFDKQIVLNASMKASRLLAQTYFISKDETLIPLIENSVQFVLNQQKADGSFEYSNKRSKIDNYHTAYVLDCLHEISTCLETDKYAINLKKGYAFYRNSFFTEDAFPKFYNDVVFPLDCTSAGQSLLTLVRFGDEIFAKEVAEITIKNMQSPKGSFYFRKYKNLTVKLSFMRWSNAWMFVGMAFLLHKSKSSL